MAIERDHQDETELRIAVIFLFSCSLKYILYPKTCPLNNNIFILARKHFLIINADVLRRPYTHIQSAAQKTMTTCNMWFSYITI